MIKFRQAIDFYLHKCYYSSRRSLKKMIQVNQIMTGEGFAFEVVLGKFKNYFFGTATGVPKKSCTPSRWNSEVVGREVQKVAESDPAWQNAVNAGKAIAHCLREDKDLLRHVFNGFEQEVFEIAEIATKAFYAKKRSKDLRLNIEELEDRLNSMKMELLECNAEEEETRTKTSELKEKLKKLTEKPKSGTLADNIDPETIEKLRKIGEENKPEKKTGNGNQNPAQNVPGN